MAVEQRESWEPGLVRIALWFYLFLGGLSLLLLWLLGRWDQAWVLARGKGSPALQALAGLGIALGLVALSRVATSQLRPARELEKRLARWLGVVDLRQALAVAALSGISEELFFRILLLQILGPLGSTLVFALLHVGPGRVFLLWTLMAGGVGALFAAMVTSGWGLLAVALAHAGLNAINLRRLGSLEAARRAASVPSEDEESSQD